jgi:hypothetical protein
MRMNEHLIHWLHRHRFRFLAFIFLVALGIAAWIQPFHEGRLDEQAVTASSSAARAALSASPRPVETAATILAGTQSPTAVSTLGSDLTPLPKATWTSLPSLTPTFDAAVESSHTNGIILWGVALVAIVVVGTLSVASRFRRGL